MFFLADLIKIQRTSYYKFLSKGLIEQLSAQKSIFRVRKHFQIILFPQYYQLIEPSETIRQSIINEQTFECQIFIPVLLDAVDSSGRVEKKQHYHNTLALTLFYII